MSKTVPTGVISGQNFGRDLENQVSELKMLTNLFVKMYF